MPLQADIIRALVDRKLVTEEQILIARRDQENRSGLVDEILVEMGFLKEEDALQIRAEQLNVPYLDVTGHSPEPALVIMLPEQYAHQKAVLPLAVVDGKVTVAMANPEDFGTQEEIQRFMHMPVGPVLASRGAIRKALGEYHEYWRELMIKRLLEGITDHGVQLTRKLGIDIENIEEVAAQAPAVKVVNGLILQALQRRASDIHIEAAKASTIVKYRIDGILHEFQRIPLNISPAVVSRLKIMCKLDITEKRMPQDGSFHILVEGREIDFRVAFNPNIYGEKIVMRILDKSAVAMDLNHLGFKQSHLAVIRRNITRPYGIILVTGPTGSGKSTTFYSALASLNYREKNIVTVEDPVEYQLEGIVQHQVNPETELSFSVILRSIMRQDPDIIMVGEIRDLDTAQIAVRASLTGHLVLSTLHTNDAPSAVSRMTDLGVEPALLASSLRCVLAQRLSRTICTRCKEPVTYSPDEIPGLPPELAGKPLQVFRGRGCRYCSNTGYRGRTVVAEIFELNDEIRTMIIERTPAPTIRQAAIRNGMVSLYHDALQKMLEGKTTLEEVLLHSEL